MKFAYNWISGFRGVFEIVNLYDESPRSPVKN